MFNVIVAAKFSMHAKIKYTELSLIYLLSLGLMYMKKFTSFCQVLKKVTHKRKLVPFSASWCKTHYTGRGGVEILLYCVLESVLYSTFC